MTMWTLALILSIGASVQVDAAWLTSQAKCEETGRASIGTKYRGAVVTAYKCTEPGPVTGINGPILSAKPLAQQPHTEPK